jgi:hypothetical protein
MKGFVSRISPRIQFDGTLGIFHHGRVVDHDGYARLELDVETSAVVIALDDRNYDAEAVLQDTRKVYQALTLDVQVYVAGVR